MVMTFCPLDAWSITKGGVSVELGVKHPTAFPLVEMPVAAIPAVQVLGSVASAAAFPVVDDVIVAGRSAATMVRRPKAPATPLGVARNEFAVWPPAKVAARVPEVVTGDPATANTDGMVRPTEVTAPPPPPLITAHPVAAPVARIPRGALPREQMDGVDAKAVAVAALPVVDDVRDAGRSAATMSRSPKGPAEPLGAARKVFAVCPLANVSAKVPAVLIGEPPTVKMGGALRATEVTVPAPVPPPGPVDAHVLVATHTMNCCEVVSHTIGSSWVGEDAGVQLGKGSADVRIVL